LATSRKNLNVLAIFFQTLIAKHTTIIFQTLSKKPTTLNSNLKLKFCGNAYIEESSEQLYNNQPWTISLDNLKNKIETFISKFCFEIITDQMNNKRNWKRTKNLELTNNIQVVFCVQGPGGSNLKLTNEGGSVGT